MLEWDTLREALGWVRTAQGAVSVRVRGMVPVTFMPGHLFAHAAEPHPVWLWHFAVNAKFVENAREGAVS